MKRSARLLCYGLRELSRSEPDRFEEWAEFVVRQLEWVSWYQYRYWRRPRYRASMWGNL